MRNASRHTHCLLVLVYFFFPFVYCNSVSAFYFEFTHYVTLQMIYQSKNQTLDTIITRFRDVTFAYFYAKESDRKQRMTKHIELIAIV